MHSVLGASPSPPPPGRSSARPSPLSTPGYAAVFIDRSLSGSRWPLWKPIWQMGTPRLGRGRGQSWVPTINHETIEVAKAVFESAGPNPTPVLPLFSPTRSSPRGPIGRRAHAAQPRAQAPAWATLVFQYCSLRGHGVSSGAALSGSTLECGPGKVTLQWVGTNYRPTCSPF